MKNNLVFLHGFLGLPGDFSKISALLPKTFDIHSIDYFHKPNLDPHIPLAQWGGNFLQYLEDHISSGPVAACGYSLGGRLLCQAFLQAPEKFSKIILLGSFLGFLPGENRQQRAEFDRLWSQKFLSEPWPSLIDLWNHQDIFVGSNQELPRQEDDFDRHHLSQAFIEWSPTKQDFHPEVWQTVQEKLVYVYGERDIKYFLYARALKEFLPKATYIVVPNAGHRVHLDQAQALAKIIDRAVSTRA